jgi:polysaccharide export outer membrane protein
MAIESRSGRLVVTLLLLCACAATGCTTIPPRLPAYDPAIPRELAKVTLPDYVIEPPDVLLLEARRIIPKPPYHIERLDVLFINVAGTFPDAPISGEYTVDPDGVVRLGPQYGSVNVVGRTIVEAQEAIQKHLNEILAEPQVSVELARSQGLQQITGEHLVRPDGTVALGMYGNVRLAGLTLGDAKKLLDEYLANYLQDPDIYVDVIQYATKVCYLIVDGAGLGEQVFRFPISGNETVLDVVGQINGLPSVASKGHVWVARPGPSVPCDGCGDQFGEQILPVDWVAITQRASTATNYQILPGDRIYVDSDHMIAFTNFVDKVTAPFERIFGFTLLGHRTVRELQFGHIRGGFSGVGSGLGGF